MKRLKEYISSKLERIITYMWIGIPCASILFLLLGNLHMGACLLLALIPLSLLTYWLLD